MKFHWHHLFVPHEHNNHRAWIVQAPGIALLIGFYFLNQQFIKFFNYIQPGILGYSSEITTQKVVELTNKERQKQGLAPLEYNSVLSISATKKAQDMFKSNYWAHVSPTGTTPWDFFKNEQYRYSVAGENLAKDFADTDTMIKAWMNSPTHRANILSDKYLQIGIGVVNGTLNGVKTTLVVQHFATPLVIPSIAGDSDIPTIQATEEVSILAEDNDGTVYQPVISPLSVTKIIGALIFALVIVTLIIDGYLTITRQTPRLAGSASGHVGYLIIILILLIAARQGAIF